MDNYGCGIGSSSVSEIEELEAHHVHQDGAMAIISEELHDGDEDCVYVAVGKGDTSMEALSWTLKNLPTHSTTVYLIHVFPEIKHIPNPCKFNPSLVT